MSLKKWLFYPLEFVLLSAVFYIFLNASIAGLVYPFAFSFMFALVWVNQKPWIVCPAFFLTSVLNDFSFMGAIPAICCVFVLILPYYIHVISRKNMKIWELSVYALISQLPKILMSYFYGQGYYFEIVSTVSGVLFMNFAIFFLQALFSKRYTQKLNVLELVSGGVILGGLSDGLTNLWIGPFSFLKLFASFLILFVAYCSKSYYAVFMSVILGFGTLVGTSNPVFIAPLIIWAMFVAPFRTYKRFLMPVALILSECLCGFYFDLYYNFSPWQISAAVVSCLVFIAIPEKVYDEIRRAFLEKSNRTAIKDVVNRNKEVLESRLLNLSEIFADMDRSLKKLAKKSLSQNDMKEILKREVKSKVCENCPEKNRCFRNYLNETDACFNEIADISFEKGKINILDMPNFLNTHCTKVTSLISVVNTLCMQYKRYCDLIGSVDTSKLLLSEQFFGISNVMKNLSKEIVAPISFDNVREEKIKHELLLNEVICDDIVVFERDIHNLEVTLLVKNEDKNKLSIPKIVGKICGSDMIVTECLSHQKPGYATLTLQNAPKYDCVFGLSSKTKFESDKSGDCHSILKLGVDKFLFALCDGMGSGKEANEVSESAISLVENLYKAGFDSDLVVSSANKLLNLQKEEVFSAVDICVFDLKNGIADFVKMGTPSSFLLGKDRCQIIEGEALPLGIVNESQAKDQKIILDSGDFVVLATDGISDSFDSDESFGNFLCSLREKNPQTLSDKILEKALKNNQNIPKDDMTVLVVKIL